MVSIIKLILSKKMIAPTVLLAPFLINENSRVDTLLSGVSLLFCVCGVSTLE